MRGRALPAIAAAIALLALAWAAPAQGLMTGEECVRAEPAFGFCDFDTLFEPQPDDAPMQAGSHPEEFTVELSVNTEVDPDGIDGGPEVIPSGEVKDLRILAPPGLMAAPSAVAACETADFLSGENLSLTNCPAATAIGKTTVEFGTVGVVQTLPVYNLVPGPGAAAKIGFVVEGVAPVTVDLRLNPKPPHNGIAEVSNVTQVRYFFSSTATLWGVPADESHDGERHACLNAAGSCPVAVSEEAFLTLPTSCEGKLQTSAEADSWQSPGQWAKASAESDEEMVGCARLPFDPEVSSQPTTNQAGSASGLQFGIDVEDPGLTAPEAKAASQIKKTVVALPEGVTLNPSAAEGLAACSVARYEAEGLDTEFGEGCPAASKVGAVEVESPLLKGAIFKGEVFVAEPFENPFDSLLAIYITVRDRERGIFVGLAGEVVPDPRTGRLTTIVEDIPQVPFSHFRFRFREGARAPLITPNACGTYTTEVEFTPWARPGSSYFDSDSFQITSGVGGGPCPPGGTPPFEPGFTAGTLNNDAGAYSPFYARITRRDGDQDMTKFSFELPEGLVGKIAGLLRCTDAQIAAARSKSGSEELAAPSCPPGSEIGSVAGGAGVGSQLTYVEGKLYLAGPRGSAPLSVVAIVPAVAGPFDVGNVVTHVALKLNPITAQVEVDGANSEPIPHILAGIPLRVRDVRVNTDRPEFTLNPTDCSPKQILGQLWGGGVDVFDEADDAPVTLAQRFQAANCARLGFRPRLKLDLKGGTARGDFPALRLRYLPRAGQANLERFALAFPRSAFVEQGHFRTICTRVQFAAGAGFGSECPEGSIYGHVRAFTPLLDEPLAGPVFLRSSNHNLPDVVLTLHGSASLPLHFEVASRIDSVKGRLRAIAEDVPDAPISRVVLNMQGGQKGLFVNSANLCRNPARNRARANLRGQNGRLSRTKPVVRALGCKKQRRSKAGARRARLARLAPAR